MLSRILLFVFLFPTASSLFAEDAQRPLGFVIRPAFFENLTKNLNDRKKSFHFSTKIGNLEINGEFQFNLSKPEWIATPGKNLNIRLNIENYKVTGTMLNQGITRGVASIEQKAFSVLLEVDPAQFYSSTDDKSLPIQIDPNGQSAPYFSPKISIFDLNSQEHIQPFEKMTESEGVRLYLWNQLKKVLSEKFSNWTTSRLRGFIVVQSLAGLMKDSPVWKEGPILSRGGLTIEMDGIPVSKRRALFAMTPFKNGANFVSSKGLEIYADARFLKEEQLGQIYGQRAQTMTAEQMEAEGRTRLINSEFWATANFQRPAIQQTSSDLSLLIPTQLVNDALSTVYREGLLRFKTTIHLGKQTQGIISPEAPEVSTVVGISPRSAPQIQFSTRKPILQIVDYALDISTAIEDRLIPSSQILTNASIPAELQVASDTQTINLQLDAPNFKMNLEDLTKRMNSKQKEIFEKLANGLWKDFLEKYSNLILFPSVIETQQAELEVVGVDMGESVIQLHANISWGEIDL